MGMWDFIRKMAAGKPVFEEPPAQTRDEDLQPGWNEEDAAPGWKPEGNQPPAMRRSSVRSNFVDERGRKIIPKLSVTHCKSHLNGNQLDTTVWFTNDSLMEVELEKFMILSFTTRVGRRLQPGEGHEVRVYHGNVPMDDHDQKAQLFYKIVENGDGFRADYWVEFDRQSNGMYLIEELHADPNVHDLSPLI